MRALFPMRWLAAVAALAALLSACVTPPPAPKTIVIPEERLARLIAERFPLKDTLAEVFDVVVAAPKVSLDAAAGRINTALSVDLAGSGVFGALTQTPYQGRLDLSYGLRFEPADGSVRLADVQVTRFQVDGAPEKTRRAIERLGAVLARQVLQNHTLYTLKPEDLQAAHGRGYRPGALAVVPGGISLTLEPLDRR